MTTGSAWVSPLQVLLDGAAPRAFFVTIRRGREVGFLLGPYDDHDDAIANVTRGRQLAVDQDPWAAFDSFGTACAPLRTSVFGT